jgi:hypothetical protein
MLHPPTQPACPRLSTISSFLSSGLFISRALFFLRLLLASLPPRARGVVCVDILGDEDEGPGDPCLYRRAGPYGYPPNLSSPSYFVRKRAFVRARCSPSSLSLSHCISFISFPFGLVLLAVFVRFRCFVHVSDFQSHTTYLRRLECMSISLSLSLSLSLYFSREHTMNLECCAVRIHTAEDNQVNYKARRTQVPTIRLHPLGNCRGISGLR